MLTKVIQNASQEGLTKWSD